MQKGAEAALDEGFLPRAEWRGAVFLDSQVAQHALEAMADVILAVVDLHQFRHAPLQQRAAQHQAQRFGAGAANLVQGAHRALQDAALLQVRRRVSDDGDGQDPEIQDA